MITMDLFQYQVEEKGSRLEQLEELVPNKEEELADAQQEAGTTARNIYIYDTEFLDTFANSKV